MARFLETVETEVKTAFPAAQVLAFGHIADSNMHFLCATGKHEDIKDIYAIVYRVVGEFDGSVSAEHGIGVQKIQYLAYSRSPQEIALMQMLKQTLDPKGILNPGRVLPGN